MPYLGCRLIETEGPIKREVVDTSCAFPELGFAQGV
jgi:hypothetical protein